jgi:hypothetical protein
MCLISYHPPGVPADEGHLRNGIEVNDEGFGYAIADGGTLLTERSMDPDLLDQFLALRQAHPGAPAVWHSRLSTGSAARLDKCHPMVVGDDPQTVLVHNGRIPAGNWADRSDTEVFAQDIFPRAFADLDDEPTFWLMEKFITTASKVAIVTVNPRYRENVYVTHLDQWLVTPGGVLHSNSDFLGKGAGWQEEVSAADGHLRRWRTLQPGQCRTCGVFHPDPAVHTAPPLAMPAHPAFRDETERREIVAAAGRVRM